MTLGLKVELRTGSIEARIKYKLANELRKIDGPNTARGLVIDQSWPAGSTATVMHLSAECNGMQLPLAPPPRL